MGGRCRSLGRPIVPGEGTRLEHDHVGCSRRCEGFTGNLTAVEGHEFTRHMLGQFISEGLFRNPCDQVDWDLTFIDIVRPLWCLLDPLQRERSRVLDSLVTYNEMLPLEPDDCLSTLSQKPPTSTQPQPTSPTAPASAPSLSSPSISPIPTFFGCAFPNPASQLANSSFKFGNN